MLQKLSYFNLLLAIIYLLVYLKSGTLNSTVGIFVIIVFNWLCIRSYQLDQYKWGFVHYLTGLWSLYYVGFIIYGTINILTAVFEFSFIGSDRLIFLLLSFLFCLSTGVHSICYFYKNYVEVRS